MYILGISFDYHDAAACILKDGRVVAAAQEERFSRIKHDSSFPANAIQFCLQQAKIKKTDINYAACSNKPLPRLEGKILFCQPHLAYASSSFFCSPFSKAAILTCGGLTTALGYGRDNKGESEIKLFKQIKFPDTLEFIYSVFTVFLGFEANDGEYKVMGMAGFGDPKYAEKIYKLMKLNKDGSFRLKKEYFSSHKHANISFNKRFTKLFGRPRNPDEEFIISQTGRSQGGSKRTEKNQYYADIAASIQMVSEEILVKICNGLHQKTGLKKLCLAGGFALNCVANSRILNETPFDEVFIQPSAGGGAIAMGAALYAWHCLLKHKKRFVLKDIFLGKEYSESEIKTFLDGKNIDYEHFHDKGGLLNAVVRALNSGKVIGWFQGRFEWGPRALGNRSILADPRKERIRDVINTKIKFREPFRPFAPSVLSEYANDFFNIPNSFHHYPLRFMLFAVPAKKQNLTPAVTHINGSSRIQMVDKQTNPLFHYLIKKFYQKTNIPILLNTSFNLEGEPIVNTPQDALNTFLKSGMDMLVLGSYVLKKPNPIDKK